MGPQSSPFSDSPQDRLKDIRSLIDRGKWPQAEVWAKVLLAEVEASPGPESVEAARVLDLLVEVLWLEGKCYEAGTRPLAERAVRLKEKLFGREHPEVAASLMSLGGILYDLHDLPGAKAAHERALAIREKVMGPEHPDVSRSLYLLANVVADQGDRGRALSMYERAATLAEKTLQDQPAELASRLNALANFLLSTGDLGRARRLQERALSLREQALGPDHPDVGWSRNNLSVMLRDMGEYEQARVLEEQAAAIMEKALGPENPYVGVILDNLGALLWQMGEQQAARQALERSLAIREKVFGSESAEYATSLGDFGLVLYYLGDYKSSRVMQEKALAIREKTAGPESLDVAMSSNNLALVFMETGEYARAKEMSERAVAIEEKINGPTSPDFVRTLDTLATVLQREGDNAAAKAAYERALATWERIGGPEPPDKALDFDGLADVLTDFGRAAEAKPFYERALTIRERIFGPDHPAVAVSLNNLASLGWEIGDVVGALERSLRVARIMRREFQQTARSLSEREALDYDFWPVGVRRRLNIRNSALDLSLSTLVSQRADRLPADAVERVLDELVRTRALVLDEMASRHQSLVRGPSREVAALVKELSAARDRLARLVIGGPGADHPQQYRERLEQAQAEKDRAERALAEKSAVLRNELTRGRIGLSEVRRALPPGGALVAFARYNLIAPVTSRRPEEGMPPSHAPGSAAHERTAGTPSYFAFVLSSGEGEPALIRLGPAGEIETLVSRWGEEVIKGARSRGRPDKATEASYRAVGERLRRRIWDPIADRLAGAKRVFVVPDGALHLVNLAALPVGPSDYLVEKGPLIHHLSAERDLVPDGAPERRSEGLLALGGPAFDDTSLFAALAPGTKEGQRGERSACGDLASIRFDPLPGSEKEMLEVVAAWRKRAGVKRALNGSSAGAARRGNSRVIRLTGSAASEAAFKEQAPGQEVLHLATHGFFLGGRCRSALESTRGVGGIQPVSEQASAPVTGDNPLLLSGLALAGANHREAAGPDEEDGILTAEEIAALDLSGVEWAVLSACDTGVGEVRAGEGVLGLRRAFQVAGARTLIMSLWSVEDESAREWMRALYEGRFLKGLDTAEAVRAASLTVLRARRARGESTHPFYWAGFVAAGDWR